MKVSTILVSALATLVTAAPTEKRGNNDFSGLNNLVNFQNNDLNYLLNINSLNLQLLGQLSQVNNFDIVSQFGGLFSNQQFDVQSLIQLSQLQTIIELASQGILGQFDFTNFQLGGLNLGLINNIGQVPLQQFINPSVVTQVQTIASQVLVIKE